MPTIGIVFDIDRLGGGYYGYAAYQALFVVAGEELIRGCTFKDGDTREKLMGGAREYCISVEATDPEKLDAISREVSQSIARTSACVFLRTMTEAAVQAEPLIPAAKVSADGKLEDCETDWLTDAWFETQGIWADMSRMRAQRN